MNIRRRLKRLFNRRQIERPLTRNREQPDPAQQLTVAAGI